MDMTTSNHVVIIVSARTVYGSTLYYPVNANAFTLARLMTRRTFSESQLADAVSMGCIVNVRDDATSAEQTIREHGEYRASLAHQAERIAGELS